MIDEKKTEDEDGAARTEQGQEIGDPNAKPSALDRTVDEDAGDRAVEDQAKLGDQRTT